MKLSDAPASVQVRIKDHAATRAFYKDKLGLEHLDLGSEAPAVYKAGKGTIIIAYSGQPTHPESTIGNFQVDDVEATVKELQAKGVVFEEYDKPDFKTVNGIVTWGDYKAAWFKDPDGYIWGLNTQYEK